MKRLLLLPLLLMTSIALAAPIKAILLTHKHKKITNKQAYYSITINYPYTPAKSQQRFNRIIANIVSAIAANFKQQIQTPEELRNSRSAVPLRANSNTLNIRYKTMNNGAGIVSIRFYYNWYNYAAAHPNHSFKTLNYDIPQQRVITLKQLFKGRPDYLRLLSRYSRKSLKKKLIKAREPNKQFIISMLNDGTKPLAKNFQYWNITPKGLLISFPPYQVAAYAYGSQQVLVPYRLFANTIPVVKQ